MKRALIGLLAVLLLLSGCNTKQPPETIATQPQQTTASTTPTGPLLHVSESTLEQSTEGAVRAFTPEMGWLVTYGFMGEYPVLVTCTDAGDCWFTRMDPVTGQVLARGLASGNAALGNAMAMNENRLAYLDVDQNAICVLDENFREVNRIRVADPMEGNVLVSEDLSTVYYATQGQIRALELSTGISRLVLQLSDAVILPESLLFSDTVLCCSVVDDYRSYTGFFSVEDGRNLGSDTGTLSMESHGETYLTRRLDGPVLEVLMGNRGEEIRSVDVADAYSSIYLLKNSGFLLEVLHEDTGARLRLLDNIQGNCKAQILLDAIMWVSTIHEDSDGNIWFLTTDPGMDRDLLCCWTPGGQSDDVVRIGKRYTAEDPDLEGLARCQTWAEELEERFGVEILLHTEPIEPGDYAFTYEFQVSEIENGLAILEAAMSKFPEGFFRTAAKVTESRKFYISLVRSIEGTQYNTVNDAVGLQYWIEGDAYMALVASADVEKAFYHELSHAMDTYVYAKSIHYDFWEDCNPKGFDYDYSYDDYLDHWDSPWLEDETRAFIDTYSMTYPHEDRARVMEYAMSDGNADYFRSETMQAKLKQLCLGIRQAFGWKKYEGTFFWEQYLNESLAYVNK